MRTSLVVSCVAWSAVLLAVACGGSSGDGIPNPAAASSSSSSGATSSGNSGSGSSSSGSSSSSSTSSSGSVDGGSSSGDAGVATFTLRFAYLGVPLATGGNAQPTDFCIKAGTRVEGPVMEKLGSPPGINVGQVSARFNVPAGVGFTLFLVSAAANACPTAIGTDTPSIDVPPQLPGSFATMARLPVGGAGALKLYVDEGVAAGAVGANARLIHAATSISGPVTLEGANGAELFQSVPFGGVTSVGASPNGYRTFPPFANRQAQLRRDADQALLSQGALSLKAATVVSLFTYGIYKNGGGTLQLLGCVDEEMQGAFTNCVSAGWMEVQ